MLEQARRKAIELDAGKAGIEAADPQEGDRTRISDTVASYLKEIEPPQREPKTEVNREDLLKFIRKLYEMSCGPAQ